MKPSRIIKFTLRTCLLASSMLAVNVQAQTYTGDTVWNPAANPTQPSDGLWNDAANWTLGAVPGSTINVHFNVAGAVPAVVTDTETPGHVVIGDGGVGSVIVTNGGSLNPAQVDWFAVGYSGPAYLEVDSGGSITVPDHFWFGIAAGSSGTLNLNGGSIFVTHMFGMDFYGVGSGPNIANINGGTLNLSQWNPAQSISGNSKMNLAGGTVIIVGDHTATGDDSIPTLIGSGKIVAYGGTGTVNVDFGNINPGATTLTGTPSNSGPTPQSITAITQSGGQISITYATTPTFTYHLVSSSSLSTSSTGWTTVAGSTTNSVTGSSVTYTFASPGSGAQYYRAVSP